MNNENNNILNANSKNSASIELILRSMQKDNEYINTLIQKLLKFVDVLSNVFSISINSQNLESFSKFVFYYCNYFIRKDKLSPGEEYTLLNKNFANKNKISILLYIVSLSMRNLILKFMHGKLFSLIEKKIHYNEQEISSWTLFNRVLIKVTESFVNFETILEKIEEYQICLLFINGKYFDFIQRLFGIEYLYSGKTNQSNEIINRDGFKFFGYLMAFKIILEFYQNIKMCITIYKSEKENLKKEIDDINKNKINENENENSKKINIKLKNSATGAGKVAGTEETNNCLLCLDIRKDTSVTICGHLFCWGCIIRYLQTNPNCPFCRQECHPQNVIFLQNFS